MKVKNYKLVNSLDADVDSFTTNKEIERRKKCDFKDYMHRN